MDRGKVVASIVTAAVLAICGSVIALHKNPKSTYVSRVTALNAPAPTVKPVPPHPKVLLLGDSYSHGTGADSPLTNGYAPLLMARHGWQLTTDSVSGGGYRNVGYAKNGPLAAQIQRTKDSKPDLIIVQEGLNDAGPTMTDSYLVAVRHLVLSDLRQLRIDNPTAPLVVIGAFAPGGTNITSRATIDDIIKQEAATIIGTTFLDPINPLLTYPVIGDGAHPTTAGHLTIANWIDNQLVADKLAG